MNIDSFSSSVRNRLYNIFTLGDYNRYNSCDGVLSNTIIKTSIKNNKGIIPVIADDAVLLYRSQSNIAAFNDKIIDISIPLIKTTDTYHTRDYFSTVIRVLNFLSSKVGYHNNVVEVPLSNGNTYYIGKHIIFDSSMRLLYYGSIDVDMKDPTNIDLVRGAYLRDGQVIKKYYMNIDKDLYYTEDKILKSLIFKYYIPFAFCTRNSFLFGPYCGVSSPEVEVRTFNDSEANSLITHVTLPDPIKLLQDDPIKNCSEHTEDIAQFLIKGTLDKIIVRDDTGSL